MTFLKDVSFKEMLMKITASIYQCFLDARSRFCKHVKEGLDLILILSLGAGTVSLVCEVLPLS